MASPRIRAKHLALIAFFVGLVIVAVIALALSSGGRPGVTSAPTGTPSATAQPTGDPDPGDVVDPGVAERGWVPEPITTDRDAYVRAALEAAGTFDTKLADRDEWVGWLKTWFTPSPLYDDPADAESQMAGYQSELDESVLLPAEAWDDLASTGGSVFASVTGDIDYLQLPETEAAHVWTATADVVVTYARTADDPSGYSDTVRVSVQVVCGGRSVPTPGSAQRPSDCKVVRFFDEAVG